MPIFTRPDAKLYYEVHGSGFPILLFAPGGLKSAIRFLDPSSSLPWMNKNKTQPDRYTVVCHGPAGQRGPVRLPMGPDHELARPPPDHFPLMDQSGLMANSM